MSENIEKKTAHLEEEKPLLELPALIKVLISFFALCLGASFLFLPWQIVLFLFLGMVLGIVVFLNLYIGILVFLAGAFFHPTYWFTSLQELHPARYLALGILFIWGFHIIIYRDFKLVKTPQNILMIAFFSLAFLTMLNSYFDFSVTYFIEIASKALVLYFVIANLVKTRREAIFLIWFLVVISYISALAGIYQYVHHVGVYYEKEGILRITGFSEDPNFFAMDLVVTLPLAIGLFFYYRHFLVKVLSALIVLCLIAATILTFSRAGLIQLLSVLLFSVGIRILKKRKLLAIASFLLAVVIFIPLIPQKYWERIQTIANFSDPAIVMRLDCWKTGLAMIADHPIAGVGFGQFRIGFLEKSMAVAGGSDVVGTTFKGFLDAQNLFIQTCAELGLIGFALFLGIILLTLKYLRESVRAFYKKEDFLLMEISLALQISFIVYLLGGFFNSYLQLLIFWIIVPFAVALRKLAYE